MLAWTLALAATDVTQGPSILPATESPSGGLAAQPFGLSSVDIFRDTDLDGISDFNEQLAGTDPLVAASRPGISTIDLLVFYSQGVPAAHNGDALARIDQILAVTNQIYQDSGVDIRFRVVSAEQRTLNESASTASILQDMFRQTGVFSDLEARKQAVGADIAITLRPLQGGETSCGMANVGGLGTNGDFSASEHAAMASTVFFSDCQDQIMAHELGHIMGLSHSRIENVRLNTSGTFPWSAGHGVANRFATVMANINDFGGFNTPSLSLFSNPELTCTGSFGFRESCGVVRTDATNGADAATSLNTTRFQIAAFTSERTDFGDDPSTAVAVPVSGVAIDANFASVTDIDFFAFTAVIGRTYIIETTQLAAEVDTAIEVRSGNITFAQDDNSGEDLASRIEFEATVGARHVVRVANLAASTGNYSLSVTEQLAEPVSDSVQLFAAVLPASRSVAVGDTATVFATLINGGSMEARNCSIAPDSLLPVDFSFQLTDPTTNAVTGGLNETITLSPGASQSFLVSIRPTAAFDPVDMRLRYVCDNSSPTAVLAGINTLQLSASTTPVPDVIALSATTTADGIVQVPPGFFTLATANVGSADMLRVTVDTGTAQLPVTLSVCETDPTTGECQSEPVSAITGLMVDAPAGATQTYSVFIDTSEFIALDAALRRLFVRFRDSADQVRGSTSVAIQTAP